MRAKIRISLQIYLKPLQDILFGYPMKSIKYDVNVLLSDRFFVRKQTYRMFAK